MGLDPAYTREMRRLIDRAVIEGDRVLDLEAGTGLGTLHAARKAKQVVAIDLSADMIARLKKKARREGLTNIECLAGSFPRDHGGERTYSVVFSSFAIVHWPREARGELYRKIFSVLEPAGRLALFSAQGEVASCFETRAEVEGNLEAAGFVDLEVMDVADIYRAITARRPF